MTAISSTFGFREILREWSGDVPAHFLTILASSTESGEQAATVEHYFSKPFRFPLFQLVVAGRKYIPSKPIGVEITQDGNWYFAENESLRVIGTGQSYEEAVLDLEQHIVHFWQYYENLSNDQVTGEALRLKGHFAGLLRQD